MNETIGKSLIDHLPRLRHNLFMLDKQYLQRLQVKGLQVREDHLNFLLYYHTRMVAVTNDPQVREMHHQQACEVKETLACVAEMIQTLEKPAPA